MLKKNQAMKLILLAGALSFPVEQVFPNKTGKLQVL